MKTTPFSPLAGFASVLALGVFFAFGASLSGQPLRVMPLGDSITQGGAVSSSYRPYLWKLMKDAGWKVDFVGSLQTGRDNTPVKLPPDFSPDWDHDHEGRWGWTAAKFLASGKLEQSAAAARADLVLVHLGTNDLFEKSTPAAAIQDLEKVVTVLRAANPKVMIVLAEIIPLKDPAHDPWFATYRAACRELAARLDRPESRVVTADVHSTIKPWLDYVDGAHPDIEGARKMADAWWTALRAYPELKR
jgi:acyl-CoA thioesterase I